MMCVRCFQVGKCLVQVDALVVSRTALIKSLKWGTAARLARFATTTRAKIGATGFGPSNSDLSLFFSVRSGLSWWGPQPQGNPNRLLTFFVPVFVKQLS